MATETRKSPREEYPAVGPLFEECEGLKDVHMTLARRLIAPGPVWITDLVILGALQRSWDLLDGCLSLTYKWNFTAAGALLRLQLDTLLRIGYLGTVKDPDLVARRILEGAEFRKLKDTNGRYLTDAALRRILSPAYPWLDEVYREASGLVHVSDKHCFLIVEAVDDAEQTARIGLGPGSRRWPESGLREYLGALAHSTAALLRVIEAWCDAKKRRMAGTQERE